MRTAKILDFPIKLTLVPDWEDQRFNIEMDRLRTSLPVDPIEAERLKPALIDKLSPYILIAGFFGFWLLLGWLMELLMEVISK